MANLSTTYSPKDFEEKIYKMWEEGNYFSAKPDATKEPFSIVLPPPNITGQLHMGHALDHTLQDILIRQKRMDGYNTLWQPGTDHASIATEVKVVERIREQEGKSKEELGRDEFLKRAWAWKEEFGGRIVDQMKKLGDSCDWEKERFTMDEGCNKAVTEFFVKLYEDGHIYRGNRIINWCIDCKTSLSDAEVDHGEVEGKFYHFYYPVKDSDEKLEVATTRPETILGDTAVAVNPDDERYRHLIGKTLIVPYVNREIEIIADDYVDMEFGTGVVKITPAHDPNDFEIGQRHMLKQIIVMDELGVMNENAGRYEGMTRYECRKAIVADLEKDGLMAAIKDHVHNVGHCYRCNTVVEPRLSKQWFVKMEKLAKPAIEALENKDLELVPDRFDKIYYNWLNNIRDWCISRQLWWGHRIPAYYCQECDEIIVARKMPSICPKCKSTHLVQDEDVLDTWFSSALWPFSTLNWPEESAMLRHFYPTSVLVTGYDIIFFWVIRMVFSALYTMDEVPFKHVLIHGLVRDSQGRKMSKSLGNGIDPLEIIDEYGADALRFTLATGNSPGNDMRFYIERVESSRNFANKIWNASRFIFMNLENFGDKEISKERAMNSLELSDKWIISKANKVAADVTENIDKFELGLAAEKIYDFAWSQFCDWYIEMVKPRLYGEDDEAKNAALYTLTYVLEKILKLLHPFMPFITEEIYSYLGKEEKIIVAQWPHYDENENFEKEEQQMEIVMEAVRSIRNSRAEMNVPPSKKATVMVVADGKVREAIDAAKIYIKTLASASEVEFIDESAIPQDAVSMVIEGAKIFLPLAELIDFEKEIERLEKEKAKLEGEIKRAAGKLTNQGFLAKAPQSLVDEETAKKEKYEEMLSSINERILQLRKK
ncbi:MAG: valine--tRNA ligase [Proteocatella sp.]|nr:valine--tRNA ligase [Proteocatella sp.]MBP8653874.1 valine--tRNA ligase [Proteocatella sp.]MBP9658204.1 valine--tRNA ligase [Proteocatella sp.]MBP9966347.1 valine--tRNA ligase [Proteocatella sp.]NCB70267.1 valine--tRNA ligase [Clostridia bacterium]